jgi:hypothetical protein
LLRDEEVAEQRMGHSLAGEWAKVIFRRHRLAAKQAGRQAKTDDTSAASSRQADQVRSGQVRVQLSKQTDWLIID